MRTRRGGEGLRTPSLRRRVVAVVLLALAVLLVVLVVATDQALSARLESQLRDRLVDRAGFAAVLAEDYEDEELARRLEGNGISVVVTDDDGETYTAGPEVPEGDSSGPGPGGPGPRGPYGPPGGEPLDPGDVVTRGDVLAVSVDLDGDGTATLTADASSVSATVTQVRVVLVATALLVLLLAALAVPLVVARALRPLDRITEVARSITRGDRGRRLDPTTPTSELGRTATAFDEMLDEVVGAEQRAVASEQRLRTFLSDAAHDLRTPITGVQAAAEHVLRDDPPRDERERVLTTLIRESRRAGRLVDDMLLITTIDAGLSLRREPVDLLALARDVVAARELSHPGLDLRAEGEPVVVTGDRDRLARALGNLVDNALGVARDAVVVRVRSGAGRAGLDVVDDGPGVPPAERERIFDRMVRLDAARRSGGAGLGLPIARGIARAHGGDVTCSEAPGGPGAQFSLVLPVA
ncbi:HAMP domain-containing sensor histidine kinase [Nocardioides sp. CFH 31398]|uniref:sensor histidine kinase n=1 Tax=Nocardioides sp. CFH 31398 TaxID=2919579 RepID=UPI001F05099A|nr:HAMP domain-containing sensor histidine kinase [Nocardioides sp. CFH 31398]MCH1867199.1 HAMP domain-containing histidine kinase [Nocardioides sp. CFH 31398]